MLGVHQTRATPLVLRLAYGPPECGPLFESWYRRRYQRRCRSAHSGAFAAESATRTFREVVCQSRYQVRSTQYWVWQCRASLSPRAGLTILRAVPSFNPPDFTKPVLAAAPDARFVPAPADGVLPEGFFSTTNLPDLRPHRRRVAPAARAAHGLGARARRRRRALGARGPPRAQGRSRRRREAEDGREGIYVHAAAFMEEVGTDGEFKFMSSEVSREKPIDYALMARILVDERDRGGYPIWVAGPALVHSRARARHGVVHRERLRRRAARRQRRRRARHRGVDLRHDARHERRGQGDAGRPRAAHARDQRGARGRLDRGGGGRTARSPTASCTRA